MASARRSGNGIIEDPGGGAEGYDLYQAQGATSAR
jgi:hypothetical protein